MGDAHGAHIITLQSICSTKLERNRFGAWCVSSIKCKPCEHSYLNELRALVDAFGFCYARGFFLLGCHWNSSLDTKSALLRQPVDRPVPTMLVWYHVSTCVFSWLLCTCVINSIETRHWVVAVRWSCLSTVFHAKWTSMTIEMRNMRRKMLSPLGDLICEHDTHRLWIEWWYTWVQTSW